MVFTHCPFIITIVNQKYKIVMAKVKPLYKWIRNLGVASFVVSPLLGYLYVSSKMKTMEKGIHEDLARIKSKGKTLADIPRKTD